MPRQPLTLHWNFWNCLKTGNFSDAGIERAVLQWLLPLAFLLRKGSKWPLVLGAQGSNGNTGALKALLISMSSWCCYSSSSDQSWRVLKVTKARGCGCRARAGGCRAWAGGCRAMHRLSLPQFKSEGQKEIGNLCSEGAAWFSHLHLNPHNALPATHSYSIVVLLAEIWEHAQRVRQLLDALSCFLFELWKANIFSRENIRNSNFLHLQVRESKTSLKSGRKILYNVKRKHKSSTAKALHSPENSSPWVTALA